MTLETGNRAIVIGGSVWRKVGSFPTETVKQGTNCLKAC